ncbi:pyridoxal phosphate-dependent aminotransferase [candidate division WOR-3 bacterium]|nr:pyridoxal phosphate-dependent aminotransferase [candidate division WOR-3 bacterium]
MTLNISNRVSKMQASPIRKLIPYAENAKKRGVHVYHLNIGQPDIETPHCIIDGIKNYKSNVLRYGPSNGLESLREEISKYLAKNNLEFSKEEIFITTAGSEAIIFTTMAICDPGDEIIIPEPFYTNYNGFSQQANVKIVPVTSRMENGFHLPDDIEIISKINEKTKAILICSPNNPTGTILKKDEMERIVKIAKEHNLYIISDEVYREFTFDNRKHISIFDIEGTKDIAVMIDSISKRFSACGARIGYIATKNRDLLGGIMKLGQARLCPPTVEQIGAIEGFKHMDEFMPEMIREYERRRNVVYEAIKTIDGAFTMKPEGAFYAVVKIPVDDAEKFTIFMLDEFSIDNKTTMVAPAEGFYATEGKGKDQVRIAFVLKEDDLKDAMNLLKEGLKRYNDR